MAGSKRLRPEGATVVSDTRWVRQGGRGVELRLVERAGRRGGQTRTGHQCEHQGRNDKYRGASHEPSFRPRREGTDGPPGRMNA